MHLLAEHTITAACPVEAAYSYASNLEHFGEWFPGVIAIESANGLDHATPGKEYLETVAIPLRGKRKVKLTVRQAEPGRLLVTEGALAPLLPRMELLFQSTSVGSCRITWKMFSRNDGALARLMLLPLARRIIDKRAAIGMSVLKEKLEGK
jgi:hypothetical protein